VPALAADPPGSGSIGNTVRAVSARIAVLVAGGLRRRRAGYQRVAGLVIEADNGWSELYRRITIPAGARFRPSASGARAADSRHAGAGLFSPGFAPPWAAVPWRH